ncbi:NAD(P)-binding protein [Hypoxylon sp. FL1857]|nr:NAD(P)-binding protein [Hypoxylon sp. FL1857]
MPELEIIPMSSMETLTSHQTDELFTFRQVDITDVEKAPHLIMPTGGTTGLPKPVPVSIGDWISQTHRLAGLIKLPDTLSTLPLYHSHGQGLLIRSLVLGMKLALLNALRPITAGIILTALDKSGVSALDTVPYTLKILAEAPGGIERLRQLESVGVGGSALPDDLGNSLITCGIKLRQLYGQTESGGLMEMSPDVKDGWNWLVPMKHAETYLKFEQVDENLYHLIVLPGLKTKRLTNRPDGSYGTNDLFQKHPTDPRKWRFASRHDDIIVMLNGEKADPVPLEHAVGRNEYVQVAVAFGAGRASLGMLIVPSPKAAGLPREELEKNIAPDLELGNSRVPAYARVSMDSIVLKEVGTEVPMTPKATVIRPRVLAQFASDIDDFYAERERAQNGTVESIPDGRVGEAVRRIVCTVLGVPESGQRTIADDDDFFTLGMDSLLASYVRVRLLREIDIGRQTLGTNVAFDHPSIKQLSQHVLDVRHGVDRGRSISNKQVAWDLIQKYTQQLAAIETGSIQRGSSHVVLLTGATGTIGRFILYSLLAQENVSRVYCLVRANSDEAAAQRIRKALKDAHLLDTLGPIQLEKIVALSSNLGSANLGVSEGVYENLRASVTAVIHNAWAVNFNMQLTSFENPPIASVLHLLNITRQSKLQLKPRFVFISSVAAIAHAQPTPITESRHGWDAVGNTGYAQSKWVAEELCTHAAQLSGDSGPDVQVIRVGQIAGDSRHGIWNPGEAIPLVVQTGLTVGALPVIEGNDEVHFWLPVDICAAAVVQLALLRDQASTPSIFHISSTEALHWNAEFLPALKKAGLRFEELPQREWVSRLEKSDSDVQRNPPYRLLEYFKGRYGNVGSNGTVKEGSPDGYQLIDISIAKKHALALENPIRVDEKLIAKFVRYWLDVAWKKVKEEDPKGK